MLKIVLLLFLLCLSNLIFPVNLPQEIVGIRLGSKDKEIKLLFALKKVETLSEGVTYKILYSEEENINTYITFFEGKVYKITLSYNEKFVEETDWQNIYNQAILYYGRPHKVYVELHNSILEENYVWENQTVEYICKRVVENDKFKNFYIILVDLATKEKIAKLSFIKKLWYRIINIFK